MSHNDNKKENEVVTEVQVEEEINQDQNISLSPASSTVTEMYAAFLNVCSICGEVSYIKISSCIPYWPSLHLFWKNFLFLDKEEKCETFYTDLTLMALCGSCTKIQN